MSISRAVQPPRQQPWATLTPAEVLALYKPGHVDPMQVLEVLITLFNSQHTALEKTVSHKTRHERAQFLRRFFRDLKRKAGFKTLPDPRHLRQKHLHAMVAVWSEQGLASATVQTYLSFLRGLAQWLGKPGLVHAPPYYGLQREQYQRHENAQYDHSWSAQGVDANAVVDVVCGYDRYVGASLRLILAFGLRRKESVLCRPYAHLMDDAAGGSCLRVKGKGGRVRTIAVETDTQRSALLYAQGVAGHADAHVGNPQCDLRQNLRRFDYVMRKFGLTLAERGVTAHGLRHQVLLERYASITGCNAPVRGGGEMAAGQDLTARKEVALLAGHARPRASGAYLGGRDKKGMS